MKVTKFFLVLLVALGLYASETVEVGCEYYRPYVDKINGKIVGPGYEIAKNTLNKAGVKFTYKVLPWSRVWHNGLHKKNYMIGCVGRTPVREKMFQWIGPMEKGIELNFYTLKSNNIKINSLDDLKKYKVACIKKTYGEDFLVSKKFPKKSIKPVIHPKQLIKMLKNHRIDFILINKEQLEGAAKKEHFDLKKLKKAFFGFKVQNYLAFSKQTPKELVEKVKKAYEELQKEGRIKLQ